MKAAYRLTKNSHFSFTYKKGKYYACKNLVLVYVRTGCDNLKVGFSVSKKVGKSVVRNKIKRRIREAFAKHIPFLKQDYNYVFIARKAIINDDYKKISASVEYLLKKTSMFLRQ
ncbi:MAG: ribonuclease P protein component [Clostridia bacterium]|nr:ribonuclease P protein component [Clostridia bacterium]